MDYDDIKGKDDEAANQITMKNYDKAAEIMEDLIAMGKLREGNTLKETCFYKAGKIAIHLKKKEVVEHVIGELSKNGSKKADTLQTLLKRLEKRGIFDKTRGERVGMKKGETTRLTNRK